MGRASRQNSLWVLGRSDVFEQGIVEGVAAIVPPTVFWEA
jgi:hypothetical protein